MLASSERKSKVECPQPTAAAEFSRKMAAKVPKSRADLDRIRRDSIMKSLACRLATGATKCIDSMMPTPRRTEAPKLVVLHGGADVSSTAAASSGAGKLPSDGLSDEAIVEAVRQGDRSCADQLYFRLVDAVDITLFRIFGRREADHEDLVQRAFEQIVLTLSRRTFAGACSLRTWASAITARVAFNVLRSRRRERAVLVSTPPDQIESGSHAPDAESVSLAREDIERLKRHLTRMKPDRAQAVFLHDVLGHELAEIAVMEDISVAAAQSRLVRGRKDLYKRLGMSASPGVTSIGAGSSEVEPQLARRGES
jgi:RNA polymerase sigma-70 factor (ECF subfamily)